MAQINLHTTPEFEDDLATVMRERGIRTKSEAIRLLAREAAAPYKNAKQKGDWRELIGFVHRLPGGWQEPEHSFKEFKAELDREMFGAIDRPGRRDRPK